MENQRMFFVAVIGALLLVLAIFAIVVLVIGDEDESGDGTRPNSGPVFTRAG